MKQYRRAPDDSYHIVHVNNRVIVNSFHVTEVIIVTTCCGQLAL